MSDNDGRYPDESPVLTPYPRSRQEEQGDRAAWPWLPGTVLEQCGPDEWLLVMDGRAELATPDPDHPGDLLYPLCNRDSSELRAVSTDEWEKLRTRKENP